MKTSSYKQTVSCYRWAAFSFDIHFRNFASRAGLWQSTHPQRSKAHPVLLPVLNHYIASIPNPSTNPTVKLLCLQGRPFDSMPSHGCHCGLWVKALDWNTLWLCWAPAIIRNFVLNHHPNYICSDASVRFSLAAAAGATLSWRGCESSEQNKNTFIRSHALINRWKVQLGVLIISAQRWSSGNI